MVQRPFNFAIVDEVDFDPDRRSADAADHFRPDRRQVGPLHLGRRVVKTFVPADYDKDEKQKSVVLTEDGTEKAERMLEERGPDRGPQPLRHRQHPGRPPLEPGAQGQRHVQEGHRLHRQGREGRHHRRVHRPNDGRAALVRRAPPGGRGQGRRRRSSRRTRRSPRSPSRIISACTRSCRA